MEPIDVPETFAGLIDELRELEQMYNPDDADLHLNPIRYADDALFARLADLTSRGLGAVQRHRDFFATRPLYADGMFWYRLCLLISSAATSARRGGAVSTIPISLINGLALDLVGISEWSGPRGLDMHKRTFEALGEILLVFPNDELWPLVEDAGERAMSKHVHEFVRYTLERVCEIRVRARRRAVQQDED